MKNNKKNENHAKSLLEICLSLHSLLKLISPKRLDEIGASKVELSNRKSVNLAFILAAHLEKRIYGKAKKASLPILTSQIDVWRKALV